VVSCQPVNPLLNNPQDLHSTVLPCLAEPMDSNHDARQKRGTHLKKSGLSAGKTTTSVDQIRYDPARGMVYSNQLSSFLDISTPSCAALYPEKKSMSDKITRTSMAKPDVAEAKH